jgi:hypothetical protein
MVGKGMAGNGRGIFQSTRINRYLTRQDEEGNQSVM